MPRKNYFDVIPADIDERRRQHLPAADLQFPDLCVRHGDEIARLGHVVGDPRARDQVDVALDAVARREDRDFGFFFHGHSMRQVWSKVSLGLRGGTPFPGPEPMLTRKFDFSRPSGKNAASTLALSKPDIPPQSSPTARSANR